METTLKRLARIDRVTWLLIAAFVALGGYLVRDRGGELSAALPSILLWLVVLACPLMHILMHRHGGQGGHGKGDDPASRATAPTNATDETSVDKEK